MTVLLQRLLAFAAVAAAVMWMIRSAPTGAHAALREFYLFVPLTLMLGLAGLCRALVDAWREGWRRETEGVAVLSLLAIAWGHDAFRAAIRRAAQTLGHGDAAWMEDSGYRLASGALIVAAALLVLRWATRHDVAAAWRWPQYLAPAAAGELPWALFAVAWITYIAYQHHALTRILAWFYTLLI